MHSKCKGQCIPDLATILLHTYCAAQTRLLFHTFCAACAISLTWMCVSYFLCCAYFFLPSVWSVTNPFGCLLYFILSVLHLKWVWLAEILGSRPSGGRQRVSLCLQQTWPLPSLLFSAICWQPAVSLATVDRQWVILLPDLSAICLAACSEPGPAVWPAAVSLSASRQQATCRHCTFCNWPLSAGLLLLPCHKL